MRAVCTCREFRGNCQRGEHCCEYLEFQGRRAQSRVRSGRVLDRKSLSRRRSGRGDPNPPGSERRRGRRARRRPVRSCCSRTRSPNLRQDTCRWAWSSQSRGHSGRRMQRSPRQAAPGRGRAPAGASRSCREAGLVPHHAAPRLFGPASPHKNYRRRSGMLRVSAGGTLVSTRLRLQVQDCHPQT